MNEEYIEDSYPISPLQQGMLFHSLYAPQSGIYIPQMIWSLHEDLNLSAFKQAWEQVVKRHPILRTSFHWEGLEEPLQKVHQQVNLPLIQEDWHGLSAQEQESRLETYLHNDRRHDFELTKSPLMRLALFQISETDYQFIWTYHHALLDGQSRLLIVKEIFAYYEAFCQGYDLQSKQPRPYRAHIEWLQQQNLSKAKAFWQQTLKGFSAPTSLIQDQVTDSILAREKVDIPEQEITLSKAETAALKSLAQQNELTLNTVLQGAWVLLLSRYSGSEDVVFGATRACRHSTVKEAKDIVGLFINVLPIRVQVSPEMLLIPWLKKLRAQWITMREYEQTSHLKIQEWSDIPPGTPLFESTHDFRYSSVESTLREQGGNWKKRKFRILYQPNVPLSFQGFGETELFLKIQYNRSRFEDRTIARMLEHIKILLESIIANPEQHLSEVRMLTERERKQILVDWNDTSSKYPHDRCIHQLFEEQVEQIPDAVAVVYGDQQLTYRELNASANQLAHYLKNFGVEPEVLVGICVQRSLEMVVGLLGILKAGGAYVPLDPAYPRERLAFMLKDSQVPVLLTQNCLLNELPELQARVICLDKDWKVIAKESDENSNSSVSVNNPAYLIYTSGSTGTPKGVLGLHRGAVNRFHWMWQTYPFKPNEICCQKTSLNFLDSLWEIFGPLLQGIPTVIIPDEAVKDPQLLVQTLASEGVTRIVLVPSLLKVILDVFDDIQSRLSHLNIWVTSGEMISGELTQRFKESMPEATLLNLYGSSEVSADCTWYETHGVELCHNIPIGRPIANTQVYILDAQLQPVPIGVAGQLYTGGDGLARGYLNRQELTAENFIPDPFSEDPAARLYKTGDLARYLPDGNIEYLGRKDHQVKVRGFRVELGEIESQLKGLETVSNCVVVLREDRPADQRLTAYYVCKEGQAVSESEVRRKLQAKLPGYMVPQHFVELSLIPLTPSGKVDRQALPAPDVVRPDLQEAFVAPRSQSEELVAGIWSNVLGLERIGVYDSFFELGGHSLLVVRIVSRIREAFGVELPVRSLFEVQTIAGLTELIETIRLAGLGPQPYRETTTSDWEEGKI
jgi:amino acid adenylation domain-containing protein